MDRDATRANHDIGGVTPFMCLPVDTEPHALSAFDKQVDAIQQIVRRKELMNVHELRRGIEAIPAADYHRMTYYERWLRSIIDTLLRNGVVDEDELRAAMPAE